MSSTGGQKPLDVGPTGTHIWNAQNGLSNESEKVPESPLSSTSSVTQEVPSSRQTTHPPQDQKFHSGLHNLDDNDLKSAGKEHHVDMDIERQKPAPGPPLNPMVDPSAFPDGGMEAWTVVFGGFCALFVSFGWITCIGVFQDYYQNNQLKAYSPSTIAWIPSLETCIMFIVAPVCGKAFDNYGPRYIILFGTILHVFGLMMASISTEYYQILLAQGICSPLGAGALFYPSINSVTTWFHKRRAFALGIVASGSSVGGVMYPIMVSRLVPRVGFGWAMRICAFLILALCIVVNLTVKSRLPPHPKPFKLKEFFTPFLEIPFLLTTAGCWLFFFGMYLPFTYIVSFARHYGMSPYLAGYLVSIMNASSTFGRTLPSYAADRIGRFNVMVITSFLNAIMVLALWIPSRGNIPVLVFSALYGFTSGAFVSLGPALVAQISDVRQIGVRTGAMFAVTSVASLTGNPIGGALLGKIEQPTYWRMQVFAGVVMAVGSVSFLFARVRVKGWELKKKF
ncbi:hypothetical protein AJ79_05459 [Helicocarpus griseus UAMH5409]|uniref:Major facilitator superfamily (MFS) profile domain-containing protein n=1 Tax=Helicocarpus griseus UAMH5409 TaxID=1447875 RepID=A0A2B7XM32_9EURO|nr:hypothetical protein AJ79_05459 [Helicocarpus griseus UAMH5409]